MYDPHSTPNYRKVEPNEYWNAPTEREAALRGYAPSGVPVILLVPGQGFSWKKKLISGTPWGASKDLYQLTRDFGDYAKSDIGIPTGTTSGLFVIDTDTKEGHPDLLTDGEEEFQKLVGGRELPETRMAASPSGGRHRYYLLPTDGRRVKTSTSTLGPGIDVKGEGGMCVVPPTRRKGGAYTWLNDKPIEAAPDWLLDLVAEFPRPEMQGGEDFNGGGDRTVEISLVDAALAAIPNPYPDEGFDGYAGYDLFLRMLMATFDSTGGSDTGLVVFDAWARQNVIKYNKKRRGSATRRRWLGLRGKPPPPPEKRLGYGTLHRIATLADPGWFVRYLTDDPDLVAALHDPKAEYDPSWFPDIPSSEEVELTAVTSVPAGNVILLAPARVALIERRPPADELRVEALAAGIEDADQQALTAYLGDLAETTEDGPPPAELAPPPAASLTAAPVADPVPEMPVSGPPPAVLPEIMGMFEAQEAADNVAMGEPGGAFELREKADLAAFRVHVCPVKTQSGLDVVRLSKVEAKAVEWFWPERVALGKLTILVGLPDVNKSTVALYMASLASTSGAWPAGEGIAPKGNIVVLTAEDGLDDTVKPRFEVAGGEPDWLFVVRMVKQEGQVERHFDLMEDIRRLEMLIEEIGNVVLIIIDPISAYMSKLGKLDSYRDSDVRGTLMPLHDVASRQKVAVVGLLHLNKNASTKEAMLRVSGSIAMVGAPRAAYLVVRDEDERDRRLFLPVKNNLTKKRTGLAFRIADRLAKVLDPKSGQLVEKEYPAVVWENEPVEMTADEALAAKDGRRSEKLQDAKQLLLQILTDGPQPKVKIDERASAQGIGEKSLRNAQKELFIRAERSGGKWWWAMPGQEPPL